MRFPKLSGNLLCVSLCLATWSWPASALVGDKDQPIEIESDSLEYLESEGMTVYEGNVRLTQGSIELQADRITVLSGNGQISRLVAEGTPANYQQSLDTSNDQVIASSNHMEYDLSDAILTLSDEARLTQQGTTLSGNQIVYDVGRHLLRASSSQGVTRQDRVRVTIPAGGISTPEQPNP